MNLQENYKGKVSNFTFALVNYQTFNPFKTIKPLRKVICDLNCIDMGNRETIDYLVVDILLQDFNFSHPTIYYSFLYIYNDGSLIHILIS